MDKVSGFVNWGNNLCEKEHRNEILDELLRQDAITEDKYKQLNIMLAESLDDEMDLEPSESEEEEFKKMIEATANDVFESDKKYLMELLTELKEEVTEVFIGDVLQLEKLIDAFHIDDYLEGNTYPPDDG